MMCTDLFVSYFFPSTLCVCVCATRYRANLEHVGNIMMLVMRHFDFFPPIQNDLIQLNQLFFFMGEQQTLFWFHLFSLFLVNLFDSRWLADDHICNWERNRDCWKEHRENRTNLHTYTPYAICNVLFISTSQNSHLRNKFFFCWDEERRKLNSS